MSETIDHLDKIKEEITGLLKLPDEEQGIAVDQIATKYNRVFPELNA
jgi:hypothetical protein